MTIESDAGENTYAARVAREQFYDSGILNGETDSRIEAERLDTMAIIADGVSIETLKKSNIPLENAVIVDIGAGDSVSLGKKLSENGAHYIPIDQRPEAVAAHQQFFPDARIGDATNFADNLTQRPDFIHARFTYAWLTDNQRIMSLAESFKSFGDAEKARFAIIDYDWSIVKGPKEYLDAIGTAVDIMRSTGFNPAYGKINETDIYDKLTELNGDRDSGSIKIQCDRYELHEGMTLGGSIDIVRLTAQSIIERLDSLGMADKSEALKTKLALLEIYTSEHPDEPIVLPGIVAVEVEVDNPATFIEPKYAKTLNSIKHAGNYEGSEFIFQSMTPLVKSNLAVSDEAKLVARRIQAAAYYTDNIVDLDAIDSNGALIAEIDPDELVDRSAYIVTGNNNNMAAVVRMIKPAGNQIDTLPTMQRLKQHSPKAYSYLVNDLGLSTVGGEVFEVSGLAKLPGGTISDVVDTIISLSLHSSKLGYKHAVMGLQESHVTLIRQLFGPEAVRLIPTEDAAHPVHLPGVNRELYFRAMYVDVPKFIENVDDYAEKNKAAGLVRKVSERTNLVKAHQSSITATE